MFITPIFAGLALTVGIAIGVGLFIVDSLVLGPGLWAILTSVIIACLGVRLTIMAYHNDVEHGWLVLFLILTLIAVVFWIYAGVPWLKREWPRSPTARWFYSWSIWWKIYAQLFFAGSWLALVLVGIRLAVEIFDPGWSRGFEQDRAATVGVKANFPVGGERFPVHALDQRVRDLETELANAKVEMRQVTASVTGENGMISRIPGLPDDNAARRFYRQVADDPSKFSVRGAKGTIGRVTFEDLRDKFINRGWAYWVDPGRHQDGTKFRAEG